MCKVLVMVVVVDMVAVGVVTMEMAVYSSRTQSDTNNLENRDSGMCCGGLNLAYFLNLILKHKMKR